MSIHPRTSPSVTANVRHDGWTADKQHDFITALAETGCVRHAAAEVGMSASTAYRLRARRDGHAFRAAWDAARGLAGERLIELAMARVRDGLEQRTYDADDNLIARKLVHNDRLLMFLIAQNRLAAQPGAPAPDDAFGSALDALDLAPAGAGVPPPVSRGGFREDLDDDALIVAVRDGEVDYFEAYACAPALRRRLAMLCDDPRMVWNCAGENEGAVDAAQGHRHA